jgi:hypothetical protein
MMGWLKVGAFLAMLVQVVIWVGAHWQAVGAALAALAAVFSGDKTGWQRLFTVLAGLLTGSATATYGFRSAVKAHERKPV